MDKDDYGKGGEEGRDEGWSGDRKSDDDNGRRPIAIRVRNAVKSFKRKDPPILDRLDMTVREGTM